MRREIHKDPAVRFAIFKVHGGKCYYLDRPLTEEFYHLDHIIPQHLKSNSFKLQEYLKEIGWNDPFEIDSLINLVPADPYYNSCRKKDKLLPPYLAAQALSNTKDKLKEVELEIEKFKKNRKFERPFLELISFVEERDDKELFVDQLYNMLTEDKSEFEEIEEEHEDQDGYHTINKSYKNVKLIGFFPTIKNPFGSCLITFKSLKIRDCMISFNHDLILKDLLMGVNSPVHEMLRKFIVGMNQDKVCLQLGNNRFFVQYEQAEQLCKIIDKFAQIYISKLKKIEVILGLQGFKRSKELRFGYRLLKINRFLWKQIINFTNEFDINIGGE